MKMKYSLLGISFLLNPIFINRLQSQDINKPILQNAQNIIFNDRIEQQGKFVAKAMSAFEIVSNNKSPANEFLSSTITFKLALM